VFDPAGTVALGPPLAGNNGISAVAFIPGGHTFASAGTDGRVRLWHLPPTTLVGATSAVDALAFDRTGRLLATADADGTIRLWDTHDPTPPASLTALTGRGTSVLALAFRPDGRVLADGESDGKVRLWDMSDPRHAAQIGVPLTGNAQIVYTL